MKKISCRLKIIAPVNKKRSVPHAGRLLRIKRGSLRRGKRTDPVKDLFPCSSAALYLEPRNKKSGAFLHRLRFKNISDDQ